MQLRLIKIFLILPNKRPHLPGRVFATVVPPSSVVDSFLTCDVSPSLASLPSPFSTSAVCCLSRRNLYGIEKETIRLYFLMYIIDKIYLYTKEKIQ